MSTSTQAPFRDQLLKVLRLSGRYLLKFLRWTYANLRQRFSQLSPHQQKKTKIALVVLGVLALLWVVGSVMTGQDNSGTSEKQGASAQAAEGPAAWADRLEVEYLDMVGRDSWLEHCLEDNAKWACETHGMDATSLGMLQVQMNGQYDDPYMQDLADNAINAVFASLAFNEPTEEHMDWVIAVDHQGAPIKQESCQSAYGHMPNEKPVCAQ